jgi:hypothetical protein
LRSPAAALYRTSWNGSSDRPTDRSSVAVETVPALAVGAIVTAMVIASSQARRMARV